MNDYAAAHADPEASHAPLAPRLLAWYERNGRKHLPWQTDGDPYRIWVSEIMLQQTQVTTVIPYFNRFVARFPDVAALASGDLDEVLHLWTGLGYYARARNLHRAARIIRDEHAGRFPQEPEQVYRLPGIGRSTAHAILAFSFGHALPILDGNVKRVLARHYRVHGWPGRASVTRELWRIAAQQTPAQRTSDYTQAIMDLGATVCIRRNPLCDACPLEASCRGRAASELDRLPGGRPSREKPSRTVIMVMMTADARVLLERRPPAGIWGGLWSLPEIDPDEDVESAMLRRYGVQIDVTEQWDALRHGFTHFNLEIRPLKAQARDPFDRVMENTDLIWYNLEQPDARGLAAPVKKLLQKLR